MAGDDAYGLDDHLPHILGSAAAGYGTESYRRPRSRRTGIGHLAGEVLVVIPRPAENESSEQRPGRGVFHLEVRRGGARHLEGGGGGRDVDAR